MKLGNQLTFLETSQYLKELKVKQESIYYWLRGEGEKEYRLFQPTLPRGRENLLGSGYELYSAFTVAELGEMLPEWLYKGTDEAVCLSWRKVGDKHQISYEYEGKPVEIVQFGNTEAEARAKMLIYLLENELIEL